MGGSGGESAEDPESNRPDKADPPLRLRPARPHHQTPRWEDLALAALYRQGIVAKIAYEWTFDDQLPQIYVMNADGSHPVNLTGTGHPTFSPSWSPDGTKILFTSDHHDNAFDSQIFVMNADGSNQHALTDEDGVIDRHPSWQPVGGGG